LLRPLALALAITAISMATVAAVSSESCSRLEFDLGHCSIGGSVEDNEAVLQGNGSNSGSNGGPDDSSDNAPTEGSWGTQGGNGNDENDGNHHGVPSNCPIGTLGCQMRDDYEVVVVTLSDIARFRPSPGIQRMEPDGWVVVGLPANIYSIVDRQIVPGELLGQSADVRFTPVAWHWSYGDGATATLATKGGTWAALGLDEFDATPTSHVYKRAGSYTIRLSISFRAEYRIAGGPFVPIVGTITLPANELHITASGAKTVLVDRDCTIAPRGPGC